MRTRWKVLIALALVVPLGAYAVGTLAPSTADDNDRSRPVIIGEAPDDEPAKPEPSPRRDDSDHLPDDGAVQPGRVDDDDDGDDDGGDDDGRKGGSGPRGDQTDDGGPVGAGARDDDRDDDRDGGDRTDDGAESDDDGDDD